MFVLGFSVFFAILGYGGFHGGFKGNGINEPGGEQSSRCEATDAAHDDLI